MNKLLIRLSFASAVLLTYSCKKEVHVATVTGHTYYVASNGDDASDGSMAKPWATISRVNILNAQPGDTILFRGGNEFKGQLQLDSVDRGSPKLEVFVSSFGRGKATINGGNTSAIVVNAAHGIRIKNLIVKGSGRKGGNTESGIIIRSSSHINVDSVEVAGFQKSGLYINASTYFSAEYVHAHDNGAAGISLGGTRGKNDNHHIVIRHCLAENNPGDPTNFDNHSGNGILVGLSTGVLVEYCVATNNGWDMPRVGNGPVGIWAYEADSVVIRHCISYKNKTARGAEDGGGFDFDGGVTNSIIEYCLSYENQGSGFGIFQYEGASPWINNTIRFCVSHNDGLTSRSRSGIFIWNGDKIGKNFRDLYFYNNVIVNTKGTAINFDTQSKHLNFKYFNNIFVAGGELTKGKATDDTFIGNDWWSLTEKFNINGIRDFKKWAQFSGQEMQGGTVHGMNVDPGFLNRTLRITDPLLLISLEEFKIAKSSKLQSNGVDLKANFNIDPGQLDFNGRPLNVRGIGLSFEL
ncbi:MAG: right-handed parallel beta-helix repeat-containing protein [Chryseolinea sp.]